MVAAKEAKEISDSARGKELKQELIGKKCSRQNAVPECIELDNEVVGKEVNVAIDANHLDVGS